jgi:hypothetical protein
MRTPPPPASPDVDTGLDMLLGRMGGQTQLESPKTPNARPQASIPNAPSKRNYYAALAASSSALLTSAEQAQDCQRRKRGLIEYLADACDADIAKDK